MKNAQTAHLATQLPLQSGDPTRRSSAAVFNAVASPLQPEGLFNEWQKLSHIENPSIRKRVRRLRLGQVDCGVTRHRFGQSDSPECPRCGCDVEDAGHLILECPATQAHRDVVVQSVHKAASLDSDLASLIKGQTDVSVLLASLGAPLQGPLAAQRGPWALWHLSGFGRASLVQGV